jgi:hypothetical protein
MTGTLKRKYGQIWKYGHPQFPQSQLAIVDNWTIMETQRLAGVQLEYTFHGCGMFQNVSKFGSGWVSSLQRGNEIVVKR